jgi:hypothetical protein
LPNEIFTLYVPKPAAAANTRIIPSKSPVNCLSNEIAMTPPKTNNVAKT